MNSNTQSADKKSEPKAANLSIEEKRRLRKKSKVAGRVKRVLKLKTDKEFAKQYFEARSKKASEKKSAFRKKKSKKK